MNQYELIEKALEIYWTKKTKYKLGTFFDKKDGEFLLTDCLGLIEGIMWGYPEKGRYKSNGVPDLNTNGLWKSVVKKGTMDTFPDRLGLLMYLKGDPVGHVGIYLGYGRVLEATGNVFDSKEGNGLVISQFADKNAPNYREWYGWLEYPYIDYVEREDEMVERTTFEFKGATVKVARLSKQGVHIRGSVDDIQYGHAGQVRVSSEFKDTIDGYTERLGGNGGIFYYYKEDKNYYSQGLSISKSVITQDLNMSAVSDFRKVLAVGFPKTGGVVFDLQEKIEKIASEMYGALTFAFGIMHNRSKSAGEIKQGNYSSKSGRTILAEDERALYLISVYGVTGKSGLKGNQLYDLCKCVSETMINAGCFDGGGSVWGRAEGVYLNNTSRKVKNAWMIFAKPIEENWDAEGMFFLEVKDGLYKKNGKEAIATRETATSKYDVNYPLYVGDVIGVVGYPHNDQGNPVYQIGYGPLKGRWVQLDSEDMKKGILVATVRPE